MTLSARMPSNSQPLLSADNATRMELEETRVTINSLLAPFQLI